jgi:hypothetical protein
MVPTVQCAQRCRVGRWCGVGSRLALIVSCALFASLAKPAQNAPPTTVGRVEGLDVTVDGGTSAGNGSLSGAPSIYVVNGGVVTVHSGQAQLKLVEGGKIDICGPAKFTLLQSGPAITLALNFGRLHVELPRSTTLQIFTPTIIATPLDIRGGMRDITVGLDTNDSLCVRAATGALQLEHQFTGEKIVVPQDGEFSLAEGKLLPVAGAPGGCACPEMQARAARPSQQLAEEGVTAPVINPGMLPPIPAVPSSATKTPPPFEPAVGVSVLASSEESKAAAAKTKNLPPPLPAESMPEYTAIMPPLTFFSVSPAPPPDAGPETILLVRVAHVFPYWEFSGHVDAPPMEGASVGTNLPKSPNQSTQSSGKQKGGFWSALKRFFGGG